MTEADLLRIESELGVQLPADYRDLVRNHPIRAERGTANGILWDDPDAVIELNLKYRRGFAGLKAWPEHFYMIGDDGAASPYVLDLRTPTSPVYLFDHGSVDAATIRGQTVTEWMGDFIQQLIDYGVDPDAPPARIGTSQLILLSCAVAITCAIAGIVFSGCVGE